MPNRALAFLTILAVVLIIYSCGGDNPTGSQSELESENGDISGLVNSIGDAGGIQDALLELSESDSVVQETYSDDNGEFSFTNVESGQYEVTMTLPQGYKESGTTSNTVQVDNDVNIEFEGEPIKEETATVKAGEQDTVATASGAFIAVDARETTSDIQISIAEIEEGLGTGSKTVKIQIRPSGASKSSVNPAKRIANPASSNTAALVDVDFGQKTNNSEPATLVFNVETDEGPIALYANPNLGKFEDPNTKKESEYYIHSVSTSPTTDIELELYFKHKDSSCDNEYRKLKPIPGDNSGEIALILIHGLQLKMGNCEDFNDFKALDLEDGDMENTFDQLVTKLTSDETIDNSYKFYTYRYPTNAPIKEASDELWNLINKNENIEKPVIIAHSMGGVVARKLILDRGEDKISALITLGTPHQGTRMADFLTNTISYSHIFKDCSSSLPQNTCEVPGLIEKLEANIGYDTPGLRDLSTNSPIIGELDQDKGNPLKIFTLGGRLGNLSAIFDKNIKDQPGIQFIYQFGYHYLGVRSLDANDGIVPLSSAVPDWSGLQAELYGHDHTEIVRGEDYSEVEDGSISSYLIPLLQKLIPTSINENSIYVSSAKTNVFTTAPSDLYGVELSPEGQDLNIGRIETSKGEDIIITDIAEDESGELWGISYEEIYRIDRKTGFALRVGKTGFESMNALEIDSNGRLLALTGNGSLIEINKQDGRGELISELQDNWRSVGDIAIGPDGDLFAVLEKGLDNNVLATIEMNTGKVTPVNPDSGIDVGYGGLYGITFFKDTLYGLTTTTNGGNLLEINTSTGTGSKIRSLDFQASGAAKQ